MNANGGATRTACMRAGVIYLSLGARVGRRVGGYLGVGHTHSRARARAEREGASQSIAHVERKAGL